MTIMIEPAIIEKVVGEEDGRWMITKVIKTTVLRGEGGGRSRLKDRSERKTRRSTTNVER